MICNFKMVFAAFLLLSAITPAKADQVDRYIEAKMQELHVPGLSLAVVRKGQIIKSRGYGLANLELKAPVTEDTVFEIGSITKQFTAVAVMMLVEEGKVGLDDKIDKYLSGVPPAWSDITLRHLLTHSSGIQNYLDVSGLFEETARPGVTHDDMIKLFFRRLQLEFRPGETWSYSNTNYLLLGDIIEKVSGKSYWEFLDQRIFKPLGMNATRSSEPSRIILRRASGYEWRKTRFENRPALLLDLFGGKPDPSLFTPAM